MKQRQLFSILILSGISVAWSGASSAWSQTAQGPGKGQTQTKDAKGERMEEEKMEARGAQEPGRMETERKKGETEMEARGAQKPGRMEKSGAESMGPKESQAETWAAQDVKKAQEALKSKGHNPGSMDGIMGAHTRQAIKAFQKANGLKESGSLDAETSEKLGVEKGSASGASSKGSAGMGKGEASPTQQERSSSGK